MCGEDTRANPTQAASHSRRPPSTHTGTEGPETIGHEETELVDEHWFP